MKRGFIVTGTVLVGVVAIALGMYISGVFEHAAPAEQPQTSATTTTATSRKYGFSIQYPRDLAFTETLFYDGINVDSWSLIWQRPERPAPEPVDCSVRYEDEFYFGWSVADAQATTTNLRSFNGAIERRLADPSYVVETWGDKMLQVKRDIPGLCSDATEVLWREPSGRYTFVLSYPSDTDREEEYQRVISSIAF